MSTILTALKKLESRPDSNRGPSGANDKGQGISRSVVVLLICAAAATAAGSTWFLGHMASRQPPQSPAGAHISQAEPITTPDATSLPQPTLVPPEPIPEPHPKRVEAADRDRVLPAVAPPRQQERTDLAVLPASREVTALPALQKPTVELPALSAPSPVPESTPSATAMPSAVPSPLAEPAEPPSPALAAEPTTDEAVSNAVVASTEQAGHTPSLPRLDSNILKLQAVTWADSPAKRFAVVNNRILHMDESVDGYRIIAIDEDFVVVRRDGKQWEVRFRPR